MAERAADFSAVLRRRLASQFLTTRGPARASDVVRVLGAVQAQDYAGAKWALGMRTRGVTDEDVEREISDGAIVRTHVLRPTWHFVAPEDIRWMLALTAPRIARAMSYYDKVLGLSSTVFRRSNDAMAKALVGGKQLTRAELATVIDRVGVRITSGQQLGRLMLRAELDAVICSGGRRGKQFTYALFDERVPAGALRDRDDALAELARRYFTTRGPASAQDFAWWSGLTVSDAKRALQIIGSELETISPEGTLLWFNPRARPRSSPSAHLLPNYDEYFIGYRDRTAVGQRIGHARPVIGGDGSITNVVFVDGQLVGSWKRTSEGRGVAIDATLWSKLSPAELERVTRAARGYSKFLGDPVQLRGLEKRVVP